MSMGGLILISGEVGISVDELQGYMDAPNKTYRDYKSQESIYFIGSRVMRLFAVWNWAERGDAGSR